MLLRLKNQNLGCLQKVIATISKRDESRNEDTKPSPGRNQHKQQDAYRVKSGAGIDSIVGHRNMHCVTGSSSCVSHWGDKRIYTGTSTRQAAIEAGSINKIQVILELGLPGCPIKLNKVE